MTKTIIMSDKMKDSAQKTRKAYEATSCECLSLSTDYRILEASMEGYGTGNSYGGGFTND